MNLLFRHTFKLILILLAVILAVHVWAVINAGYYTIWWLDIVLHFLGGFLVGLVFILFIQRSKTLSVSVWMLPTFLIAISSFGVFIGLQWEFFEFLFDALVLKKTNMLPAQLGIQDTMLDFFLDWIGALSVAILFLKTDLWKERNSSQ